QFAAGEARQVDVERQAGGRQHRREGTGAQQRRPVGRGMDAGRGHQLTSRSGGDGRGRKGARFIQSFSACQWMSATVRSAPAGRRNPAASSERLVRGRRGPASVAKRPSSPWRKAMVMAIRSGARRKPKVYPPATF